VLVNGLDLSGPMLSPESIKFSRIEYACPRQWQVKMPKPRQFHPGGQALHLKHPAVSDLTFDISGYPSSEIDGLCALMESYTVASFQGGRQTVARPLRIEFSGALYHPTSRGNDGQAIYLQDEDRTGFLQLLEQTCGRYDWLCHAYCLMDNHYHLLIETQQPTLSKEMKYLNGKYTQNFSGRYALSDHVFRGRFIQCSSGQQSLSSRSGQENLKRLHPQNRLNTTLF
jgi:REP element-mobilizing transposase RayT